MEPDKARKSLHEIFRALTRQPRHISSTEARQHFSELLTWTAETNRPLIVTNHGRPEAVILSFDAFQSVAKGVARAVLALGARRQDLRVHAEDILEEEGAALARRLRNGDVG